MLRCRLLVLLLYHFFFFFFFKQKTAYEMRISDWSSDVCSSDLASGEVRGGLALTEPDAGTDLQGIRMTAKRDGNGYVINGTKTWISNGIEGGCFALLVKTDPGADPRHKGMSLFIAPKQEGFRVGRKLEKLGYKSIDSGELVFEDRKSTSLNSS